MKYVAIILGVIIVIGIGVLVFMQSSMSVDPVDEAPVVEDTMDEPMLVEPDGGIGDGAEPLDTGLEPIETIGESAGGTGIRAYHFGDGETEVLFVGGVHGGYSYNTAALGYELVDYFDSNPNAVPDGLMVTVIPVLNPDGLMKVVGTAGRFDVSDVSATDAERVAGRFNGNDVDINRNFDCQWTANATWQNRSVSGGSEVFSEPEARALRDYIESAGVDAAVVYFSQAGGVYSSTCNNGLDAEMVALTNAYANGSGYPAYEEFDYYEVTGDMVNWMAKIDVPAISVLLSDHENTEWSKNRAGVMAVLEYLAK